MKNDKIYKITLCALFATMALITFIIENLFPPIILSGARLGLSNIFILLCAVSLGAKFAFCSLIIKTVLGSLFAGNISMVLYSLPAGAIALTVELLMLYFFKKISVVSISVAGAVINTTLQNTAFCIISGFSEYFAYLPYLTLIAIPSGVLVGFTVYLILKRVLTRNKIT